MIRITNVGNKLNDFIRSNAKRIVCTSIATIMIGLPMQAKGEKNVVQKNYFHQGAIDDVIIHNEISLKNDLTEKNYL